VHIGMSVRALALHNRLLALEHSHTETEWLKTNVPIFQ